MSYTPSPILKLYIIADQTEDYTWGPLTSANLQRLEEALHGYVAQTIAGSDVTLNDDPYVGTQSHKQTLYFTGIQSDNVDVIVPTTATHLYHVLNATTASGGPWTLTVKTAAGTGIALKHGEYAVLLADGTNVVSLFRSDEFMKNTADMDAKTHKITNVVDPTNAQDAATKAYVDTKTTAATQTFTSTDATADAGPVVTLDRNSASPAANDHIGVVSISGRTTTGATKVYSDISCSILDPTNTSEDAQLELRTTNAGTLASRVIVGQGLQVGSPTAGDKGVGTVNATAVYVNGVDVIRPVKYGPVTASGSSFEITGIAQIHQAFDINFRAVSGNGNGDFSIEIGDAVSYKTLGYLGRTFINGISPAEWTTAITLLGRNTDASLSGTVRLSRCDANISYSVSGVVDRVYGSDVESLAGYTPAVLTGITRIRIVLDSGTFDAGTVTVIGY